LLRNAVIITFVQSTFSLTAWKNITTADRKSFKRSTQALTFDGGRVISGIFSVHWEASIFIVLVFVLKAETFRTIKHFVLLTGTARYKTI
jgi:hypothetical protein